MEHSETSTNKKHAIAQYPDDSRDSTDVPRDKKRQKLSPRKFDCGLRFCHKGDIQTALDKLNCHELMDFKQVSPSDNPLTHAQRKNYAFRRSIEIQLKIPVDQVHQTGKRYHIHAFHWPIVLIQERRKSSALLNAKCIKNIEDQQRLMFGITNRSLAEHLRVIP
jgi:hypothetical protein